MKKFLALLLAMVMSLSLAACGGSDTEDTTTTTDDTATEESAASDVKIGLICVHDVNSGYDAAHIEGLTAACEELGIDVDSQVVFKYNIAEDQNCYDAAVDLAEQGCNIIFSDSYGHQTYMLQAAREYSDITFVSCTGDQAGVAGLDNFKNIFPYTYESRYVSGVVAGMKLKELMDAGTVTDPKVGYVGAFPYAEVVCGYTAFLLGIQSVVPEAYMEVQYTNSWYDPEGEGQAAQALIDDGCDVIAQHCDTNNPQIAARDAGVWGVGYNSDMTAEVGESVLTSVVWNWGAYYTAAVQSVIDGTWDGSNYYGGMNENLVGITSLADFCTDGTQEAVDTAKEDILSGKNGVFDGVIETNTGETVGEEGKTLDDATITGGINWYFKTVEVVE